MVRVKTVAFAGFGAAGSEDGTGYVNDFVGNLFVGIKNIFIEINFHFIPPKTKSAQPKPRTKNAWLFCCDTKYIPR